MTTFTATISTSQYAGFMLKLKDRFMPAAKRGVLSGVLHSLEIVRSNTLNCAPASPYGSAGAFNIGVYWRGWRAGPTSRGAVIYNDVPYAPIIELGRRPGRMPPRKAIAPWLKRKLHLSDKEAEGMAFVVARAIGKRGLEGRHVLEASIPDIVKRVEDGIDAELRKELARRP